MKRAARKGVNWFVWRVVTHGRIPDGFADIRTRWTFADLLESHFALDALDDMAEG